MVHQPDTDCQNISLTRMPLGKRLRLIVVWMFYCGIVGVFLWTLCLFKDLKDRHIFFLEKETQDSM